MQAQNRTQPKSGKSPIVTIKTPHTFVLKNGLKVMVVENHKLPKVTFNLTLDNAPFAEGDKKGVDELCSNMIGNGTKNIAKDDFNEEVDFLGANIGFSSQGAYASSLSKYAGRILELMADGALHPKFTVEEFENEKTKLLESLKIQEKSVPAIANRIVDVLTFGKQHPSGEYITKETLNNITLADIESNYQTYFVPENAYLVVIGDVTFKTIKPIIEKLFSNWESKKTPKQSYTSPTNVTSLQINFVDVPNAVQSEISFVNSVNLKMSDPDFFAAVFAAHILGSDFNSYLNMNLREKHAWTYGTSSTIGSSKYISKFRCNASVRNAVTDSAVVEFIKEIKKIREEKVIDELLHNTKAGYIGRFVMKAQQPQAIARYALNIEIENLSQDFYTNYIKNINAVTKEDVQKAATKYILLDNMRIVITGKGSEVIPGLEKLNIPISYFDKLGNPIEKPIYKTE